MAYALVLLEFFHPLSSDTPPAGSVRIFPAALPLLLVLIGPRAPRGARRCPVLLCGPTSALTSAVLSTEPASL